jgi:hypothetical protein
MMSGESSRLTITKAAERIARSKGISDLSECGVRWSFDLPKLTDEKSLTKLRRFVERWQLEAIIIDPAYLAIPMSPASAGCSFVVGDYLRQSLSRLREDTGATPVLMHHSKDRPGKRPALSDLQWAGFGDWARQWVLLSRRKPYSAQRPTQHSLYLQIGSPIGHSSAWTLEIEDSVYESKWDVQVSADEGPQPRAEKTDRKAKADNADAESAEFDSLVLSHVPDNVDGLPSYKIADAAGRGRGETKSSLERLATVGKVRRIGEGTRGHRYTRSV